MSEKSAIPVPGRGRWVNWSVLSSDIVNIQNVPSGILELGRGRTGPEAVLDQGAWEGRYLSLRKSRVDDGGRDWNMPSLSQLKARVEERYSQGQVSLALAYFRYHRPDRGLRLELARAQEEGRVLADPEGFKAGLTEQSDFFAGALLPVRFRCFEPQEPVHRGLEVRFLLDDEFCLSNTGLLPEAVQADFGDGRGWRELTPGEALAVNFPTPGDKQVSIQCRYGPDTRVCRFAFKVRPPYRSAGLSYDDDWEIEASIPYQGQAGKGTAYVFLGSEGGVKHTQIVNPILIADGFPGHDINELIGDRMLNQDDFFLGLLAGGYDAIVLTYQDGTDYIQRNALMTVECINHIMATRSGSNPLVCGGASMGGLVVRYALAYMEANGMTHDTGIFFTMDTPHKGANVPLGVQFALRAIDAAGGLDGDGRTLLQLLNSVASRQMLIYYLQGTDDGPQPTSDPDFIQFFNELSVMGGYPSQPRKIGISCGSAKGVNVIPHDSLVVEWSGNACANGEVHSTPQQPDGADALLLARFYLKGVSYTYKVEQCYDQDGAPGGTAQVFGGLAASLDDSGYGQAENYYDDNCFVSSISALDLVDTEDPCQPIPVAGADTPFDQYWIRYQNMPHIKINHPMKEFFYRVLGISPPVDREGMQAAMVPASRDSSGSRVRVQADIAFQDQDRRVDDVVCALNQFELRVTGASDIEFRELGAGGTFLSKESLCADFEVSTSKADVAFSGGVTCLVLGKEVV